MATIECIIAANDRQIDYLSSLQPSENRPAAEPIGNCLPATRSREHPGRPGHRRNHRRFRRSGRLSSAGHELPYGATIGMSLRDGWVDSPPPSRRTAARPAGRCLLPRRGPKIIAAMVWDEDHDFSSARIAQFRSSFIVGNRSAGRPADGLAAVRATPRFSIAWTTVSRLCSTAPFCLTCSVSPCPNLKARAGFRLINGQSHSEWSGRETWGTQIG